jgi:hypothetical protein
MTHPSASRGGVITSDKGHDNGKFTEVNNPLPENRGILRSSELSPGVVGRPGSIEKCGRIVIEWPSDE